MKTRCKHCKQKYEIDDAIEGRKLQCPLCGKKFIAQNIKHDILKEIIEDDGSVSKSAKVRISEDILRKFDDQKTNLLKQNWVNTKSADESPTDNNKTVSLIKRNGNKKTDILKRSLSNTEPDISDVKFTDDSFFLNLFNKINFKILGSAIALIIIVVLILLYFFGVFAGDTEPVSSDTLGISKITCDKFDIDVKVNGSEMNCRLDTDLPDDMGSSINVYRTFTADNKKSYSIVYYREDTTIEYLKNAINISISEDIWKEKYDSFLSNTGKSGKPVNVSAVSDKITIYVFVNNKQSNEKYGRNNINIIGKAVDIKKTYHLIRIKKTIDCPY